MRIRTAIAAGLMMASMTTAAQAGEYTLEQRVQRIEDDAAIRALLLDYTKRLTARDFDGYVANFLPDGVWQNGDIVKHGRAEIKAMLEGMFPETPADYVNTDSYMLVSNIVVDLAPDGETAHVQSRQLSIIRGKGGTPTPVLSGMYEDELVKVDGRWFFRHRNDITLMPSPAEWRVKMESGIFD